jgi:two-component system sensor histidine kinase ArlS
MKVRYKITAAFLLLTITVLASLCMLAYYITKTQQQRDFSRRMHNRTSTIANLLEKLPENSGYEVLSKLDSATSTVLVFHHILVYDSTNREVYEFDRDTSQHLSVAPDILVRARKEGYITVPMEEDKQLAAISLGGMSGPVVTTVATDENGKRNLSELTRSLLTAFLLSLFLACVTGWLFSRRLLKPVEDITNRVTAISATNIEARLPESSVNDEWNRLSVTFNGLLKRLQESFEIQGRFISNASHELSTPLTVIRNQIDVVLQKERDKEEYLHVLQSVNNDVQHMTDLTQQLLTLARTARGGALPTDPIRVDEIIMEIPALLRKISSRYQVEVFFSELPDNEKLSTVEGNYELLLSAISNIAENGCKYSPDQTVRITLAFHDRKIYIEFCNQIESFNPAEIDAMFQPFQRGANAETESGYGLGLHLARRIILLHKGEAKAEIRSEKNMCICVILPSSR